MRIEKKECLIVGSMWKLEQNTEAHHRGKLSQTDSIR